MSHAHRPLTERILRRLPGPRWVWLVVWAAIPLCGAFLPDAYIATVGPESFWIKVLTGLAFAYSTALALWGVSKFTRDTAAATDSLDDIAGVLDHESLFRGIASTTGPVVLASVFIVLTTIETARLASTSAAVAWIPVTLVTNIAGATGIWVYLSILFGLDRLGSYK